MAKTKPGIVKTGLDELTYRVNGLAMQVCHELKAGHPEKHYQRRLAEVCREAGLSVEAEKRVEVWIEDSLVGYLFLDLWIEEKLVVECKAFDHDLTNNEIGQALTYIVATGASVAMIYNFGRASLEFKRILPPRRVQEWQKYLYRCIWSPPGTSLPPIDAEDAAKPIYFSISASLAASVATSSSDLPMDPSVPLRLSASKSVDDSYARSGVNIDAGIRAVDLMKDAVQSTYSPQVLAGIGAFGGLFDAGGLKKMKAPVLVASTDGVGTKVKLAAQAGRYRGIGHDIVNHCINDILVQGARPLFFMDYFATSELIPEITAEVVSGMAEACKAAGMPLLGGETAEMPSVYQPGEFDVAGTIVGAVERADILPRPGVQPGDLLIGLSSSGPHTNGFSLLRKIFEQTPLDEIVPELGVALIDALLVPHRSYLGLVSPILPHLKALAHITGGGVIENLPRALPDGVTAQIQTGSWPLPPLWRLVQREGAISLEEMYRVFNMGIGMVVIADPSELQEIESRIPEPIFVIGKLVSGPRQVVFA